MTNSQQPTANSQQPATRGAIAASDPQTAEAGARMLRRGGDAIDAAVAAAFASFVIEFSLVNIGGGGIATVVDTGADSGTHNATTYDFFSDMPSGALRDVSDFRRVLVDFGSTQQPFYIGRASVAVPGVVAGLCAMAAEHGTLPLATLLEPAIERAYEGVLISEQLAYAYHLLRPIFSDTAEMAAIFTPQGHIYQAGERIHFPNLGRTLERLSRAGPDLFYTGDIARAIVADQEAHGGLLTAHDLAAYRVQRRAPWRLPYRNFTVLLPPPSSIGGVLVGFALKLLASVDVGALDHNGAEHVRLLAEVMRLTNRARWHWETSSDAVADRLTWFLGDAHVDEYRRSLHAVLNGAAAPVDPSFAPGPNDTTHITTADAAGRLVSITTSAGECAGFVVGDTGVCLNNMLGELDLHPNGFHQSPPGSRLTTMMTPTVVMRGEQPVLALGSGGSNRIRSAITQAISNVLDFDMTPSSAVEAARVHFEEGVLQLEGGIAPHVADELAALGYDVNRWSTQNMFFGGAHLVACDQDALIPVGDRRRGGSVQVVA